MSDLHTRLAGLLEDHRHKAPRVQARLVLDLLQASAEGRPDPEPADDTTRPAQAFDEFAGRITDDRLRRLVEQGVATTRNRTHAAFKALGLDPHDTRAVVIEHDLVRVYRYDQPEYVGDPVTVQMRPSIPQTVPILEESA